MHAGPWGAAGTLIPVAINEGDTPSDIKRKLEHPTGIPVASQKLVLAAFSQIAVGDKRTAIKFGSCGVTEGFGLTLDVRRGAVRESTVLRRDIALRSSTQAAVAGHKPHVPPPSANRVDNNGTWGEGDRD
jgi:hypothetical protein